MPEPEVQQLPGGGGLTSYSFVPVHCILLGFSYLTLCPFILMAFCPWAPAFYYIFLGVPPPWQETRIFVVVMRSASRAQAVGRVALALMLSNPGANPSNTSQKPTPWANPIPSNPRAWKRDFQVTAQVTDCFYRPYGSRSALSLAE